MHYSIFLYIIYNCCFFPFNFGVKYGLDMFSYLDCIVCSFLCRIAIRLSLFKVGFECTFPLLKLQLGYYPFSWLIQCSHSLFSPIFFCLAGQACD